MIIPYKWGGLIKWVKKDKNKARAKCRESECSYRECKNSTKMSRMLKAYEYLKIEYEESKLQDSVGILCTP